jgi:malate dehydrogenase (oxaloacetate-decarboxylating)
MSGAYQSFGRATPPAPRVTSAAEAIAQHVSAAELSPTWVIPDSLDWRVPPSVAAAVAEAAIETGVAQIAVDPKDVAEHTRQLILEGAQR